MRPDAFAAVMATGIVSIAADDHGIDVIGTPLAVMAAAALPVLTGLAAVAWRRRSWRLSDVDTAAGLLTFVAACCVLAVRFDEHRWALWLLGGTGLLAWSMLTPLVVRAGWRLGWTGLRDRAHGGWDLASVSTSGLAVVFVAAGLTSAALVLWPVALLAYVVVAGLVGWRAAHDSARRHRVPPDHWILMGGTAIATLAGVALHGALPPGSLAAAVRTTTVVTWVIATVQIVPLAVAGWRRLCAWPAVFPVGMYSAASHALATEIHWRALDTLSLVCCWIALALWLLTVLRFGRADPR